MGHLTVTALRGVLATLFAGALFVQALMVTLLFTERDGDGELSHLLVPIVAIMVLGAAAVQVVLVCVWRLVTMVRRGTVFSYAAFRYVHVVLGAMVAAAGLLFTLAVLLAPGEAVPPGMILMMGGGVVTVLGVALIVLVLRMLLAQAVARDVEASRMEAELEVVI